MEWKWLSISVRSVHNYLGETTMQTKISLLKSKINSCSSFDLANANLSLWLTDNLDRIKCDCPLPCEQVDYRIQMSSSYYPSEHSWPHIMSSHGFNATNATYESSERFKNDYRCRTLYCTLCQWYLRDCIISVTTGSLRTRSLSFSLSLSLSLSSFVCSVN